MVMAIMESERFEFVVFGDTTSQAETLMNKAFAMHLKEVTMNWNEDCSPTEYYGCRYYPVVNHSAYRDGERMPGF
jgi:hypothetical protein